MKDLRNSATHWLGAALVVVSGVCAWRLTAPQLVRSETRGRAVGERSALQADEQRTIDLFRSASPSVVYITSLRLRRDMFSFNVFEIPQGTGSGFIWDKSGHVVTNFHVLQGSQRARVTLADGSTWDAELVGQAPDWDLAVLRIEAPADRLAPLRIGRSSDLEVGQNVYAIGNPFGLDQTLTTGIISALGREIQSVSQRPISGVIQTDAAINPGNSGGPLLDSSGRLIGVNTAIYSPSGAYAGIGFAVPVDTVNRIVPQLVRYKHVIRPGFGISLIPDAVAQRNRIKGVIVARVPRGTAADEAGLRGTYQDQRGRVILGDVIVAVEGTPIADSNDLFRALDGHDVGDKVTLVVERDRTKVELAIVLQALEE